MIGFSAIQLLIWGRRPGSFPPIAPIESWIAEKPISSSTPTKSLAYAIATKMSKEGNMVWRTHKGQNSGLLEDALAQGKFDAFVESFASKVVDEAADNIVQSFNILGQ